MRLWMIILGFFMAYMDECDIIYDKFQSRMNMYKTLKLTYDKNYIRLFPKVYLMVLFDLIV